MGSSLKGPASNEPALPRWLPLALASALFMDLLDTAALGTALPTLAREFHTDPVELKLALTVYLLTFAIFVPASGWLADCFGARRVFFNAMVVYLIGSLCCGLSNSFEQLVGARVLQGLGGAMMTPVARLILVACTPREGLMHAMNAFTVPAIMGPLIGPPLAGLLIEVASWRWIFFINLPIGALGLFFVLRVVPRLRHPHPGRFDTFGFVVVGVLIACFMLLGESVGVRGVSTIAQGLLALAGLCAMGLFTWHLRRDPERNDASSVRPILDLSLLRKPIYLASMVGTTLMRLGLGASALLLPLLLQDGLGWSPVKAGSLMLCLAVGAVMARFFGTAMVRSLGFRSTLIVTAIGTALITLAPASFDVATPLWWMVAALLLLGLLRAGHFVAASAISYADIEPAEVSRASTLSTVIQQLGTSMGLSVAAVALNFSTTRGVPMQAADFAIPFAVLAALALLSVPVYAGLPRKAGDHMRGLTVTTP